MSSDEQEIRQLVSTWMAATQAGDHDTVLSLVSDDVVFLLPGRPVMRKPDFAAAVKTHGNGPRPQFDGRSDIQEVQVVGDWAFMWSRLSVVVTPPGSEPTTRAGYTLSVLKRENGRWVIHRDANLLVTIPNR